ncbi:MAG: protein kinase domain-containing protein [Pyrinomonadaceae bacterium]
MTPEKWPRVKEIFEAALKRAPEERSAFLGQACDGDESLHSEVESLLSSYEQERSFMEKPAAAIAAQSLAKEESAALIGRQVGHYQIIREIGRGGMGVVYLAHDISLDRPVALKLLPKHLTSDPDRLLRFEQEARAASALNHPNVCVIHETGKTDDGRHFIAMEYVEGVTLRQKMAEGRLRLNEALDVAAQIAAALAAAQSAGITHRDIKPENVMLRSDMLVKVLDFGLAKRSGPRIVTDSQTSTRMLVNTEPGMVLGTVAYMSPEQARGQEVDPRTDTWSLGVILYELITGRAPFAGETASHTLVSVLEKEPAPLSSPVSDIPAELHRIVRKALTKDREERYQTARDLLIDLKNLRRERDMQAEIERSIAPEITASQDANSGSPNQTSSDAETQTNSPGKHLPAKHLIDESKRHRLGVFMGFGVLIVIIAAGFFLRSWIRQTFSSYQTSRPPRALSRLTFDAGLQGEPAWSPDGRFIAYSSDHGGNFDIWVQPVSGGNPIQVTKSSGHDWQPDWSPDGNSLVFRSEREGGGLYVVPAFGGSERKISSFGYRPHWSPDGSKILLVSSDLEENNNPKLYIATLDGGPPRQILADFLAGFYILTAVDWHPDGQQVSIWGRQTKRDWSFSTFDEPQSFWTVNLSTGKSVKSKPTSIVEKQLTDAGVIFEKFRWAPSGQALFFEGVSKEIRNLWKVGVDPQTLQWNAGPERLTTGLGSDASIALSPDGKKLAFTTRTENTRIWSLPFEAESGKIRGEGQPITPAGINTFFAELSYDAKKLIFTGRRIGTWKEEMWQKSLEDGHETLLAADEFVRRQEVHWSRDDQRLIYNRALFTNPQFTEFKTAKGLMPAGGGEEQVHSYTGPHIELPSDWSADGYWLTGSCFKNTSPEDRAVICVFPLSAARGETEASVVASDPKYRFWNPKFSSDERWICFNGEKVTEPGISTIGVVPRSGGKWQPITEETYWADKPHWSPDDKTIYFVSNYRSAFFNVWGIRFDTGAGKPVGQPFQVTSFVSPGKMLSPLMVEMNISLSKDRLLVPITEVTGSIWMLENVDR